ncbi:MAG: response regulator [Spirochaetes bacterium]|nr:response regulator [Spirochaetota bacterium]MBU0954434.1 response regulator [Spirochaetota bacterium]
MHTILVIDDDPDIRDVISLMLEKAGYKVVLASSAQEAVAMVGAHDPAVALMDVFMPDKNGLELAMDLSQRKKGMPIILMSGRVPVQSDSIKNFTGHFGVVCSISKPFTPEELKAVVSKAIAQSCQ